MPLTPTQVIYLFHSLINLSPDELADWLDTEDSWNTGQILPGETEATGHKAGREIEDMMRNGKGEFGEKEIALMRRTVSFIKRHGAQKERMQTKNIENSRWRHSLLNWGHGKIT